jgi:hypothetical protein
MSAAAEGSLYELVARGNKDLYFFGDSRQTNSTFFFDNSYEAQAPFISELRRVPPNSTADFGRITEFTFDLIGDVMQSPSILIKLPSWLPPTEAALNHKSVIRDASNVSFGYTRAVAYFLFENIQFYQDNILLQEFSGDTLWALSKISGTYANTFIHMDETGDHDGTDQSIQKNASPPQLRLELPIIGCQRADDTGFPQRGATKHTYRLRCKLRKLEDLIEASDKRQKPTPWSTNFTIQRSATTSPIQFTSVSRETIAPIELQLETRQVYVDNQLRSSLEKTPLTVRFARLFENTFVQSASDYISVVSGGVSTIKRRIDARHPVSRIIWYFRSTADILANRLYSVSTPTNKPYFNTTALTIAGSPRESPLEPFVWRDVINYAKEEIDSGLEIYTMNWSLGSFAPLRFDIKDYTGAVNFSTADKPTFNIDLSNPGLPVSQPTTQLNVIVEGWTEFNTDGKGRAELFSFN